MWAIRAVLVVLLIIVVVAFAYFNFNPAQKVDVNLIYAQYVDVPVVTVVFWSFIAGMGVSMLLFVSIYFKQSVQLRSGRRRIQALEGEVTVLRNRPIEESIDLLKGADKRRLDADSRLDEGEK
jgi:uncharacterized membrane protein YciS (DUF1049 family)